MEHVTSNKDSWVVVGDKFSTFGSIDGAITVSQLAQCLEGRVSNTDLPKKIIFGQGVSESWVLYLRSRVDVMKSDMVFEGEDNIVGRTGRNFAHKVNRRNILVTEPVFISDKHYRLKMCIDDDCEIMADHTTGFHVQGMLLIEAARQAFLSVTEWYLLPTTENYYFVINNFDVRYKRFAFPVATDIEFIITEIDQKRDDRVSVTSRIELQQNGECICEVDVSYTAILTDKLKTKEAAMAKQTLDRCIDLAKPLAEQEARAIG